MVKRNHTWTTGTGPINFSASVSFIFVDFVVVVIELSTNEPLGTISGSTAGDPPAATASAIFSRIVCAYTRIKI